jgi:hypothetical protein
LGHARSPSDRRDEKMTFYSGIDETTVTERDFLLKIMGAVHKIEGEITS